MSGKTRNEEQAAMDGDRAGVDAAIDALGHRHRRQLLDHLADQDDAIDLTDAAHTLAASDRLSVEDLRFDLHHLHLPKLEGLGLVEFDEGSKEIRYRPDVRVEALLETIDEWW